jgi:hypothetical protein
MLYSAVIQPLPCPASQGLTESSTLAVHKTVVPPVRINTLPGAVRVYRR